jgi:hypothetical protein
MRDGIINISASSALLTDVRTITRKLIRTLRGWKRNAYGKLYREIRIFVPVAAGFRMALLAHGSLVDE